MIIHSLSLLLNDLLLGLLGKTKKHYKKGGVLDHVKMFFRKRPSSLSETK